WVVSGDIASVFGRALRYQGQSPLYFLIVRLVVAGLGRGEAALRAPSVLAMALTAFLVFRIARRLWDAEIGFLATAVFVATPEIAFLAGDARPYALGVFATAAATLALLHWLDSGRTATGIVYAILAALVLYAHYLFATTLLVHAVHVIARRRSGAAVPGAFGMAIVTFVLGILCVPLVPQVLSLYGRSATLEFSLRPTWADLAVALVPSVAAFPLIGAFVLAIAGRLAWLRVPPAPRGGQASGALVLGWHVVPRLALFAVSESLFRVFVPRYHANALPGLALLLGWALSALPTRRARLAAAVVLLVASTVANTSHRHHNNDWRLTAAWIREGIAQVRSADAAATPVLVDTGLVEAWQSEWVLDRGERHDYLLSPLACYPIPGDVTLLPRGITPATRGYLEDIATRVEARERFLLVTAWDAYPPLWTWFEGRMSARGFRSRIVAHTGLNWVVAFERAR
ncbi:MAG TPA: glycosyltransferase family 39 protein, partial [Planctomycetota bacterium]|nr:glycosyltransferase family 39 protein [Planctomycetota bacterium]